VLAFAEVRLMGGPLVDLGTASQHRATLGGHRTGWGRLETADGATTASLGERGRATLHLTASDASAAWLAVRLHPGGADTLEVAVRGQRVGSATLGQGNAWTAVAVAIPPGVLAPGDNPVELRLQGPRGRAGALVDWVWLADAEPSSLEPRFPAVRHEGERAVLALPAGTSLSYTLRVPPGARVSARVSSSGAGATRIAVRARLEDGREVPLAEVPATGSGRQELSASLSGLAGELVGLEIEAAGGDALLADPLVLRPVPTSPRWAIEGTPDTRASNLVIFLIDALRADHLSAYDSSTRVRAPMLERFAAGGTLFEAAQAQENWTKPSVATLLTSLYPSTHNTKSGEAILPSEVDTIAELLQERGFATAAFIANGYVSDRFGFDQGWDSYRNYVREGLRNRADAVVDDAIAWLEERPREQPFFMYIHVIEPHVPYSPPRPYWEAYDPGPYDGPIVAGRTAQLLEDIKTGRLRPTERDRTRLEALYDGEITYGDEHFGRFIAALDEEGLLADTLLWVTADHGEEFFDHGSVGHGHSLYQELLHVPLLVSLPGLVPAGARVPADVGLVDVLPTSFELLGVERPAEAEGQSLVPLLRGEQPQLYDASFSEYLDGGRAARSGDLKVVVQGSTISLYDLGQDPGEQRNVASERPLALRHMLTLLSMHLAGIGTDEGGRSPRPRRVYRRTERPLDEETVQQLRALGYML
jgi:arylsulfatase A-like enzyme